MRFSAILFALVIGLNACVRTTAPSAPAFEHCTRMPLLLDNFRLTGQSGRFGLLIDKGRIAWIAPAGQHDPVPADARRIDAAGMTALPGLIDSHTHLDVLAAAKHRQSTLDVRTEILPITLRQTLASGVTTTRVHLAREDTFGVLQAASDDDCFPGPRVPLSGPGMRGGLPQLDAPLMKGVSGAADIEQRIAWLAQFGVEWLALHGLTEFSAAELAAAYAAADKAGLKLMADADQLDDLAIALDAPVTSIEYLNRTAIAAYPQSIIDKLEMRSAPLYLSAPLGYYRRSQRYREAGMPDFPHDLFLFVPSDLRKEMENTFADAFGADEYIAGAIASAATHPRKFRQLRDAGVQAVMASDTGSLGQFHHDAIWQEMATWYEYGVPVAEIIDAATAVPAAMLGRHPETGTLKPGARGDVVLYSGNIDSGDFQRRHVAAVIKGGVVYVSKHRWVGPDTAETISAILAGAAASRD